MKEEILQVLAATVGALGFGVLFQIRGRRLFVVGLGGGLGWLMYLFLHWLIKDEVVTYFIVALTISLYAETMARVLKSPSTIFLAPSLIPLVPGASLYYTMSHAFDGNFTKFIERGLKTLSLAAALAVGVILSAIIMKLFAKAIAHKQKNKQQKHEQQSKGKGEME